MRYIILTAIVLFSCNYEYSIGPWEDGVIPYYLSGEFSQQDLQYIEEAISSWERVCGVKFEEVSPRSGVYGIIRVARDEWYSTIGENNSFCYMHYSGTIYDQNKLEAIKHELGHCLGLVHEHQRPDRDLYITIIWEKIIPDKRYNFDIIDNPLIDEVLFEYDYSSIMHYPPVSFSIDGSETIAAKNGTTISRTGNITEIDAAKARAIYGPPLYYE